MPPFQPDREIIVRDGIKRDIDVRAGSNFHSDARRHRIERPAILVAKGRQHCFDRIEITAADNSWVGSTVLGQERHGQKHAVV